MRISCIPILAVAASLLLPTLTHAEAVRFQNSPPFQLMANPPAEAGLAIAAPPKAADPVADHTDWSAYSPENIIKSLRESELEVRLQQRVLELRPMFSLQLEADEFASSRAAYQRQQQEEMRGAPEVSTESQPLNKTRLRKQHAAENQRIDELHQVQLRYAEAKRRDTAENRRNLINAGSAAIYYGSMIVTGLILLETIYRGTDLALVVANQL